MARKPLVECLRSGMAYFLDIGEAEGSYTARAPYEVVNGMAVVDVSGVLMAEESYWDGWGVSSYRRIASEIMGAVEAADVDGILLRIDSPGGETDGAFETARVIAEAAKKKPVWAVADVSAYSAAYLMASAAGRLIAAPESGGLGSIGVYALHMDYSGYLKEAGIRPTFIKAGDGKTDGNPYEPLSKAARDDWQAEVDRLYEAFVSAVASGRGLAESVIKNEIGARTYHGGDALVSMGLADGIGTFESVLQDFRAFLTARDAKSGPMASFAAAKAANHRKGSEMAHTQRSRAADAASEEQQEETVNPAPADETPGTEGAGNGGNGEDVEGDSEAAAAGYRRGYAEALEVVALCAIAKKPGQALGFLRAGARPAAVREQLIEAVASSQAEEVVGHSVGSTAATDEAGMRGGGAGNQKQQQAVLLAAMDKLGSKGGL